MEQSFVLLVEVDGVEPRSRVLAPPPPVLPQLPLRRVRPFVRSQLPLPQAPERAS